MNVTNEDDRAHFCTLLEVKQMREVLILPTFSPVTPVTAWRGRDCWIVGFGKSKKCGPQPSQSWHQKGAGEEFCFRRCSTTTEAY